CFHRLSAELVSEIYGSLPGFLVRIEPPAPGSVAGAEQNPRGVSLRASRLFQLLHIQLLDAVLGLGPLAAGDRLDGAARHEHAAGDHGTGGGLAKYASPLPHVR